MGAEEPTNTHVTQDATMNVEDLVSDRLSELSEEDTDDTTSQQELFAESRKRRRNQYLLEQTDLFHHFISFKEAKKSGATTALVREIESTHTDGKTRTRSSINSEKRMHNHLDDEADPSLKEDAEEIFRFSTSPPYIKNGEMREYQVHGLNWLISLYHNDINGILADEMGLGKTLQSISFLGYLKHFENVPGPHLIIAPKSTLTNWFNEVHKWMPDFNAFIFHGDKEARVAMVKDIIKPVKFDIMITSYEICLIEKGPLQRIGWKYIVIDEAHRIKNENSLLSKIVRIFSSNNRLLLTGTPLQNNLHELWALLNFLLPDVFSSAQDFDEWFQASGKEKENVVYQLRKLLSPFLLRRLKSDVEKTLLPKKEICLYLEPSEMQRLWYQKVLEKDIDAINGSIIGSKKESKTRLMNIVMQLRKVCNHPYLFDGAEPGPPYATGEHLITNSGKMVVLDKLLTQLKQTGSRILIFSQMSRVLDILEDYCYYRKLEYCRLDGQTSTEDRIQAIEDYNAPHSKRFVFLLTTRAGGLGINLTTADTVIIFDSDWNPQADLQAQDRAHRIGQTKQVKVFRFITENTVEEKVIERAMQKLRLDQLVIQQGRQTINPAFSQEDLLGMVRHGVKEIMKKKQKSDETLLIIEELIKKGEGRTSQLHEKYSQADLDDLQRFSSDQVKSYEWEGEDYSKKATGKKQQFEPILPAAKRERKSTFASDGLYGDSSAILPRFHVKGPRTRVYDFQFPSVRLQALLERERLHSRKMGGDLPSNLSDFERNLILEAEPLTEEELQEKDELCETECFSDWSKKDFAAFVKACEKYGRNNIKEIANELEPKTFQQVQDYAKVFWKSFTRLTDHEKILASIEKREAKLGKILDMQRDISYFTNHFNLSSTNSDYQFPKSRHFTPEEDYFLISQLDDIGYSSELAFERLREQIRQSLRFKFDWFLRTRTAMDLSKRVQVILPSLCKWAALQQQQKK